MSDEPRAALEARLKEVQARIMELVAEGQGILTSLEQLDGKPRTVERERMRPLPRKRRK